MMLMVALLSAPALVALTSESILSLVKAELRSGSFLLRDASAALRIDAAARELEASGVRPAWPRDLMTIDGRWRLVYSSTLALPTVPKLPFALPDFISDALEQSPFAPRGVEQQVDVVERRIINIVQLAPWPSVGPAKLLSGLPDPLGSALAQLQSSTVTLELDHKFSVEGEGGSSGSMRKAAAGSVVELRLEEVRRSLTGGKDEGAEGDNDVWYDMMNPVERKEWRAQQAAAAARRTVGRGSNPLLDLLPAESSFDLQGPLGMLAAGSFDTPFVDGRVRISRGHSGPLSELRIFERVDVESGQKVYSSWQEEEDALAAAAAAGENLPDAGDRWQEGGMAEAEAMDLAYDDNGMPDS
uniref:Plastid lipid-associated protein/fibrillin conserved domain-containing protein n=1 Tax=Calcidiscus leptoporus TaxID=127549 RepID=A0A7S0IIN5_9EUKA|mmetsp:Transcript_10635/g.24669  ORF Transcript_10635/g.24669 Transcript_10635/m.24669 type:complete len:357 (+) Transcript_10635:3-1073(+)